MDGIAEGSGNGYPLKRIQLPPLSEWRFELEKGELISVRLAGPYEGPNAKRSSPPDAEVFGAELTMAEGRWYPFGDEAKGVVSSFNGATLEMSISVF